MIGGWGVGEMAWKSPEPPNIPNSQFPYLQLLDYDLILGKFVSFLRLKMVVKFLPNQKKQVSFQNGNSSDSLEL